MSLSLDSLQIPKVTKKTLLSYELTLFQDALINYFIPSFCACILYIFILACDIGVIFRQYKDGQPIWASLTIFFMFCPNIGSYIVIISDWDLWPELEGFGYENILWALLKTAEHALFPVWRIWRYGERLFWSIDALLCENDDDRAESMIHVYAPRDIELSIFLQSYLHALPQVLLQLYILMRHEKDISKQTEDIQIASIVLNLVKISVTTTYYQRFKTQKLAGKQYPWYKYYKKDKHQTDKPLIKTNSTIELRRTGILVSEKQIHKRFSTATVNSTALTKLQRRSTYSEPNKLELRSNGADQKSLFEINMENKQDITHTNTNKDQIRDPINTLYTPANSGIHSLETHKVGLRRSSSEFYIKPYLETNIDEILNADMENNPNNVQDMNGKKTSNLQSNILPEVDDDGDKIEETTYNRRPVSLIENISVNPEPDYDIKRVIHVKGLPEDDLAGKLVSFIWWFTFILARVLTISAFAYFFPKEVVYIIISHLILVIAFLLYDVKSDAVNRGKILFFLFIGLIYIFCIIEFKIKFKKATFIYYGFFFLVFFENLIMCLIWYGEKLEVLQNDFWFRYIFYIVVMCSISSFSSMIFYMTINKPDKIVTKSYIKK